MKNLNSRALKLNGISIRSKSLLNRRGINSLFDLCNIGFTRRGMSYNSIVEIKKFKNSYVK